MKGRIRLSVTHNKHSGHDIVELFWPQQLSDLAISAHARGVVLQNADTFDTYLIIIIIIIIITWHAICMRLFDMLRMSVKGLTYMY